MDRILDIDFRNWPIIEQKMYNSDALIDTILWEKSVSIRDNFLYFFEILTNNRKTYQLGHEKSFFLGIFFEGQFSEKHRKS